MRFDEGFRRPEGVPRLAQAIREQAGSRTLRFMEICGTHTMAIAKAGLRPLLAPQVRLLSGQQLPFTAYLSDLAMGVAGGGIAGAILGRS